jgi:hypothetical protein
MAHLSLSLPELELLIGIIRVLIFVVSFLALLFSAILGLGLARLLYVGGRWCVTKIHQSYSLSGTRTTPSGVHCISPIYSVPWRHSKAPDVEARWTYG